MPDRHLRVETRELNWAPGHGFASTPRAAGWAGGSRPPSSGRSAERGRAGGADALRSSRGAASLPAAGRAHAADGWPSRETFSLRFHYENVLHTAADEKGEEERADVFAADCRFSDAERTGHCFPRGVDFKCSCPQRLGHLLFSSGPVGHLCSVPERLGGQLRECACRWPSPGGAGAG